MSSMIHMRQARRLPFDNSNIEIDEEWKELGNTSICVAQKYKSTETLIDACTVCRKENPSIVYNAF